MSNSPHLDPQDLDLVGAFAAGELDGADIARAQHLVENDPRFADEFAAQVEAIAALGDDNWYQPLNDFEKRMLRKAVVPERKKASWAVRALSPLSVAAVLVVLVGFVGMQLAGGRNDAAMESVEDSALTQSAATEAPEARLSDEESSQVASDSPEGDASDTAMAPLPNALEGAMAPAPKQGTLELLSLGDIEAFEDLLVFAQWTEAVSLDRYAPLSCWVGESYVETIGVATATLDGVVYEIVVNSLTLEARAVDSCESMVLER